MIEDILGLCGTIVAEKYEVLEAVGKGGFAIVYRARHLLWRRPVALKVFKALEGASSKDRQALTDDLVKEASLLAELSEKTASICQARDLGMLTTPDGQMLPYMVLEWLEGKTLSATLMAEQAASLPPRSLQAAIALLDPIAEGLAVAHTQGIAHRDVKPANVFISTDPEGKTLSVKLLDFGIAKVVQDAQKTGGAFQKTAGQVTAFTPNYGAPEQFSRQFGATGPWTDVFALALVVIECAAGRRLLQSNDIVDMARMATDPQRRPTPRLFGVEASDAVEAVFARAVAVHPRARFATAGAFWIALLKAMGLEPSRSLLAAVETEQRDIFAGLGSANTAPAPPDVLSSPSLGPAARVSVVPAPRASGKRALAVVFGLGFMTVVGLGLAVFLVRRENRETMVRAAPPPSSSARAAPLAPLPAPSASAEAQVASCPSGMVLIPHGEFFMGSDDDSEGASRRALELLHRHLRGDDEPLRGVQRQRQVQARLSYERVGGHHTARPRRVRPSVQLSRPFGAERPPRRVRRLGHGEHLLQDPPRRAPPHRG
jgi:serine/threonine protein kinase